jgi:hypothetical protein
LKNAAAPRVGVAVGVGVGNTSPQTVLWCVESVYLRHDGGPVAVLPCGRPDGATAVKPVTMDELAAIRFQPRTST